MLQASTLFSQQRIQQNGHATALQLVHLTMVLLTVTPRMLQGIQSIHQSKQLSLTLRPLKDDNTAVTEAFSTSELDSETTKVGSPISHAQVIELHDLLSSEPNGSDPGLFSFEELLRGSFVYIPPPPPKPEQVCFASCRTYDSLSPSKLT
jgi:hypothetical protein